MGFKENERTPTLWVPIAISNVEAVDKKLIAETAEWLASEIRRHKALKHHEAAQAIAEKLGGGAGLVLLGQERDDRDGSIREVCRFIPPVLEALRRLTRNTVRWGRNDRIWFAK